MTLYKYAVYKTEDVTKAKRKWSKIPVGFCPGTCIADAEANAEKMGLATRSEFRTSLNGVFSVGIAAKTYPVEPFEEWQTLEQKNKEFFDKTCLGCLRPFGICNCGK